MRDTTERQEAVDAGVVRLVGTEVPAIVDGVSELLDDPAAYRSMSSGVNPYGDGRACERIVNALKPAWVAKKGHPDTAAKKLETST